jgi:glycosyltransferase involved in cell wall biosynthesis
VTAAAPRVAVIVATRNRPDALRVCLTHLAAQTLPREEFEVIVVDDGSDPPLDGVVAPFAGRTNLRVVRQHPQGPAAARNAGIAATRAPVLAFTDDDCRPAPDWLEHLLPHFDAGVDLMVGGRVSNALHHNVSSATSQLIHDLAYEHHNEGAGASFFATNNVAASAAGLVRIGGFDPRFRYAAEDRDLCARWHEEGLPLVFDPAAHVQHAHQLTLPRFCGQHFRYGRGAWLFHQALRTRGRGRLARDVGFHTRFLGRARRSLAQREGRGRLRIAALLGVWQVANLAGFLYEGLLRRLPSSRPAAKIT